MANKAGFVEAIDIAPQVIDDARSRPSGIANLIYVQADFADHVLHPDGYQFISCLAGLHHMAVRADRLQAPRCLAPGGVMAVLGCDREATPADCLHAAIAVPANLAAGAALRSNVETNPPVRPPEMSLAEVKAEPPGPPPAAGSAAPGLVGADAYPG